MITLRLPAAALAAGLTLAQASPSAQGPTGQTPPATPAFGTFGVDTTQMDTAVKPGDDFFRYANGKWLATATIPADKARYGMFDMLRDKAEADVRALVDELGRTAQPAGTLRQKVADLVVHARVMQYTNQRALDQWSGYAGLFRMSYRWPTVRRFLADLHDGLDEGTA